MRTGVALLVLVVLIGTVAAVLLTRSDDPASPQADRRAQAPSPTPTSPPPEVTRDLESGEIGAVIRDRSLRLTASSVRRHGGRLGIAVDNRGDRAVEIVVARGRSVSRLLGDADAAERALTVSFTQPPRTGSYNQIETRPGRYVVLLRTPHRDLLAPPSAPLAGRALTIR